MRIALGCALAISVGCSAGEGSLARRTEAIVGGVADEENAAVVSFLDGPLDGPYEVCSAIVIGPRAVLTAAHCYEPAKKHHIQLGSKTKSPTRSIDVTAVHVYPRYGGPGADQRAGFDLAVAVTAEEIGVAPLQLAREPDDLAIGTSVELVGFGQTSGGASSSIGERRRVTTAITGLCDRLIAIGDDAKGFCAGDSGGAIKKGTSVVGLIGFGLKPGCAPPGHAVRIAPYERWISSFVTGPGDLACATCPAAGHCPATQPTVDAGSDAAAEPERTTESGCSMGGAAGAPPLLPLLSALLVLSLLRRSSPHP